LTVREKKNTARGAEIIIIIIIMVYFRQKATEHKKAIKNKTERQTEYRRTETATKGRCIP